MIFHRFYFRLKPLIPRTLRLSVRRWYVQRKRQSVANVWPILPGSERLPDRWRGWPEGKKFAFVLTHDVESPRGLNRVKKLAELEMELGFRSSFNFVPEGSYVVPAALREWLTKHGFEVGVHDLNHDGHLFASRESFRVKANRINHYLAEWKAVGFRSGYMLRNLDWIGDLDIAYDSSTFDTDPFEPQPDGVNTIFPVWVPRTAEVDALNRAPAGYVELPYTLPQDSSLFLLLREKTNHIWKIKLDWIAQCRGMALLNTHPDYVAFDGNSDSQQFPPAFYRDFLRYVDENYAGKFWKALPREVAAWTTTCFASPLCAATVETSKLSPPQHLQPAYHSVTEHPPRVMPSGVTEELSEPSLLTSKSASFSRQPASENQRLLGTHAAVVLYSHYPADPRPRRAAEAMVEAGMSVDLICLRESKREPKREVVNGVNVVRLAIPKKRGGKLEYLFQYSAFLAICSIILGYRTLRKRYDIVHAHNMPDFLVFSGLLPKLLGSKIILDLHDPMPELMQCIYNISPDHWLVRLLIGLERWSVVVADLVATPNIAFRDLFVSRGCPATKITIVMNSPQADVFDPRKFEAQTCSANRTASFQLMYHGLLVERHGLEIAIKAVAAIRPHIPSLKFHIYGERTSYMDQMIELINKLRLEGIVLYHGRKPHSEIAKNLASIDLGIIPNRRNPFTDLNMPTRIFENLAMGKPVIVPNTKGIRDYFKGNQVIFFEPDNIESLAQAINWAYLHPREVQEVVARGQQVLNAHTWTREREHFIEHLRELVTAPNEPPFAHRDNGL